MCSSDLNTILQMPAATMTWADLFRAGTGFAPADIAPHGQTGLALADRIGPVQGAHLRLETPGLLTMKLAPVGRSEHHHHGATRSSAPLPSFEIRVVGNVVRGRYIAGLVFISQQQLNNGAGTISCIDYATGEIQVGGVPVDAATSGCPAVVPPGVARVFLNDATEIGRAHV